MKWFILYSTKKFILRTVFTNEKLVLQGVELLNILHKVQVVELVILTQNLLILSMNLGYLSNLVTAHFQFIVKKIIIILKNQIVITISAAILE